MKRAYFILGYALLAVLLAYGVHDAMTGSDANAGYSGTAVALIAGAGLVAGLWRRVGKRAIDRSSTGNATDTLTLTMPMRKRVLTAAVFVAMAVACFLLMQSAPEGKLWLFQTGFGLFLILTLTALFSLGRKVSLTLSSQGLDYTPFGVGVIAWPDIRGLRVKTVGRFEAIKLDVSAPEKYPPRTLRRRLFGSHFDVSAMIFERDTQWLAAEIKRRIAAFGPRSKNSIGTQRSSHDTPTEAP